MLKSMTGYGRGEAENDRYRAVVDIKTVNSRFLDIMLKLPTELSKFDQPVRKRLQDKITCGRVEVSIALTKLQEVDYELDLPVIRGYFKALQAIKQDLGLSSEIELGTLIKLAGGITVKHTLEDAEAAVNEALDQALENVLQMRSSEGAALVEELVQLLSELENALTAVERLASKTTEFYRARLQKRIQDLLPSGNVADEWRFAQEVAYLAERSDITEETARLRSHIAQFRETLDSTAEAGKRLDFLLQEMHREVNTILSKTSSIDISRKGIELKVIIEKMKEQVQNVE